MRGPVKPGFLFRSCAGRPRPRLTKSLPLLAALVAIWCLLTACSQERSVRIRTSFIEISNDELLSPDPNRLDRYCWAFTIEYPDSIIDNEGICHFALCDTLKSNVLRVIFGQAGDRDSSFTGEAIRCIDRFNAERRPRYGAARDTLRGDLLYEVDVNGFVAGTWRDYVSYHIYLSEDEFGQVREWERGYNYALDGHRIHEADLFRKEGWESELSALLTDEFHKNFKTRDIPLPPSRKQDDAARSASPVRPNGNFKFAHGGIIWMYDAGEIAEARYGILRITLPWSKLSDLI